MTVQRKSSGGDLSETLTQVGQRSSSEDLRLVVHDESQGNTEDHLWAFIEKTVPDPQNRLPVKENRESLEKIYTHTCSSSRSPQSGERRHRGRWTSETPLASICRDTGPSAVPLQEISSSPARWGPPHPSSGPTCPGCSNLSDGTYSS